MWELDCEESWAPKNWCFWKTVVLEKTLESPLNCKEILPVHSKGDQPWDFFGRNDAETPVLWPPHAKSWLIGKYSDAGRDWGQKEKGNNRGWDGWMASLTRWTWVWVNSGSWWWTGRPGVLRFMGSQRVGHNWATELNWTEPLDSTSTLSHCIISLIIPADQLWVCSTEGSKTKWKPLCMLSLWRWLWLWLRSELRPGSLSFQAPHGTHGSSRIVFILEGNSDICRTWCELLVAGSWVSTIFLFFPWCHRPAKLGFGSLLCWKKSEYCISWKSSWNRKRRGGVHSDSRVWKVV